MEEQALLICSFLYPHNPLSNFEHVKYVMKPSENTKIKMPASQAAAYSTSGMKTSNQKF
jgi:hypothetical protein